MRAPFDGVVRDEAVDIGQFVSAGVGVGRLYAADAVEVVVPLSDADVALIPGLWELESGGSRVAARVIAEYGDERYAWQGQVDRVEASLDAQTRTIDVIVRVPGAIRGRRAGRGRRGCFVDPQPASAPWASLSRCGSMAPSRTGTSFCGGRR